MSVASDFDVNGDGIDYLLVGDNAGGVAVDGGGRRHGSVHVVFGRQQSSVANAGAIDDVVDVPTGAEITYTLRGTTPDDWNGFFGSATVTEAMNQIDLDPRSNALKVNAIDFDVADVDANGMVDFADFLVLSANFGRQNATRTQGDLNYDAVVDFDDFTILTRQFGRGTDGSPS